VLKTPGLLTIITTTTTMKNFSLKCVLSTSIAGDGRHTLRSTCAADSTGGVCTRVGAFTPFSTAQLRGRRERLRRRRRAADHRAGAGRTGRRFRSGHSAQTAPARAPLLAGTHTPSHPRLHPNILRTAPQKEDEGAAGTREAAAANDCRAGHRLPSLLVARTSLRATNSAGNPSGSLAGGE